MASNGTSHNGASNQDEEIVVRVESLLEDLIPDYLEHRKSEISSIRNAMEQKDFAYLREIGHDIEGTGGAFGFKGMAQIGRSLRLAAADGDQKGVQKLADELYSYLDRVRIEYA